MTMEDKVQKLLQPRYEVIADYPFSDYKVGQVIPLTKAHGFTEYRAVVSKRCWYEKDFNDYPAIFRKLSWWERREESEMPEYVRFEINDEDYKIGKVIRWCIKKQLNYVSIENTTWDLERCTPAIESEYLTFINKPK